ncbi:MAG: sugar phosphate isomerase/epimerase family protein, partial [Gemmataceae bacterium]
ETSKILGDKGINLVAASYQGGLLSRDHKKTHFDHFRRRLDLCEALNIKTVNLLADFPEGLQPSDLEKSVTTMGEAAAWAEASKVRVALKFLRTSPFCTNLATAIDLVHLVGKDNFGICLDVFHYYTGASKLDDLDLVKPNKLFHVQVCDIAGVARELATDRDRIFPGEGDFRLTPLVKKIKEMGYKGWLSLELLNPQIWQAKPSQIIELGVGSLNRLLANP